MFVFKLSMEHSEKLYDTLLFRFSYLEECSTKTCQQTMLQNKMMKQGVLLLFILKSFVKFV